MPAGVEAALDATACAEAVGAGGRQRVGGGEPDQILPVRKQAGESIPMSIGGGLRSVLDLPCLAALCSSNLD